ncbi:hypothetical protein TRIUR3_00904 [Triticum urartu]|uniref:Uncharacterized protein n=1 Tax=Triticum urartu TaxID=4572 RepID=M7ZI07_TRIUA|nr:hypothetical protein TRIUR3_00904 [Triticum urartu]
MTVLSQTLITEWSPTLPEFCLSDYCCIAPRGIISLVTVVGATVRILNVSAARNKETQLECTGCLVSNNSSV